MSKRNPLTLALSIGGISLAVLGVTAWKWKTPAERAAVPIAEKNVIARGGVKAWRSVRSMSMAGSMEAGRPRDPVKLAASYLRTKEQIRAEARRRLVQGRDAPQEKAVELPFVMELERPRKSRVEIVFQGQTAVQVYDGENGWKLRPFLGRREVEPYNDEERRIASQQADLDGLLIDHASKGSQVELVATEPVDGRDAYKLQVKLSSGEIRNVWIDQETSLEVRVDGTRRLDGKPVPVYTYFSDYRAVDGLLIPHVLETRVEGVPGSEKIQVEHVVVNPPLGRSRFTKPG
jgi:hypothetical protein